MRKYTQTHEKIEWESEAVPPVHQHYVPFIKHNTGVFLQEKYTNLIILSFFYPEMFYPPDTDRPAASLPCEPSASRTR
jgi:hypothetical protein